MTATASTVLSDLELDALTELVNIGVSRAAHSLRDMIGEQVLLSVPSVALVSRTRAVEILSEREPNKLVAVHQVFEGDITGRALLIFPETKSLELVRAVTGGELPLEDIIELEQEALAETGNIILNGCLATIANMLQRSPEGLAAGDPERGRT
jgi:chemotaxis protein CheC